MKLKIGGSIYEVQEEKSALSEAVSALAPQSLTLTRSADHEYYGQAAAELEKAGRSLTVDILK
jgi:hypothetical protein